MNSLRVLAIRSSLACALAATLFLAANFYAGAATECKERKCIEVAYVAQSAEDPSNKHCWLDQYAAPPFGFVGYAYDDTFAATGYGTDAKGGKAQTVRVDGKKRRVRGIPDCDPGSTPASLPPVSGSVEIYHAGPEDAQFKTKCSGSK